MTKFENLCTEYRENKRLIEELQAMNDGIKAAIIAIMGEKDTFIEGASKATYKTVSSARLDGKALQRDKPDIYDAYTTTTQHKRLTVA